MYGYLAIAAVFLAASVWNLVIAVLGLFPNAAPALWEHWRTRVSGGIIWILGLMTLFAGLLLCGLVPL